MAKSIIQSSRDRCYLCGRRGTGISLAGMCEKEPSGTLTAIKYREALLTSYSAVRCSMEIVKE